MAYFYMDTDAGSDSSDGTTWAAAKLTLEGLFSVMAAGDTGFVQGILEDIAANAVRNIVSPGTLYNPCQIIGVVDGTTAVGTAITDSDLAVTLPKISNTGGSYDFAITGYTTFKNIELSNERILALKFSDFVNCKMGSINVTSFEKCKMYNCTLVLGGGAGIQGGTKDTLEMFGGVIEFNHSAGRLAVNSSYARYTFIGVDLTQGTYGLLEVYGGTSPGRRPEFKFKNCKVPTTYVNSNNAIDQDGNSFEFIGCSDTTSQAVDSSLRNYSYEDVFGFIEAEYTAVRTGGASDNASGAFSYAMTPRANATSEGTSAYLSSPWMSAWLLGGTNTLTIHVANNGGVDYFVDEMWVEFYTPSSVDSAAHDQVYSPAPYNSFDSSSVIVDDAVSTWGGTAVNGQKFSTTVTTGFEGLAYARLHVAKRSATPDTVFLDPIIVVS